MSNLRKDIFWNTLGNIAVIILNVGMTIIISRWLGLTDVGIYTLAGSLASVFSAISTYGGTNYQITDVKLQFNNRNYLIAKIITSSLAILSGGIYLLYIQLDSFAFWITLLLTLYYCFGSIEAVLFAILQTNYKLFRAGQINFVKSLILFGLFGFTIYLTHALILAVATLLIGSMLCFFLVEYPQAKQYQDLSFREINWRYEMKTIWKYLTCNFWIFLVMFFMSAGYFIPRFLIQIYCEPLQGYFALIFVPYTIIVQVFNYFLSPLIVPIAEAYDKNDKKYISRRFTQISLIALATCLTLIPLIYFLAPPLFLLVYNQDITLYVNALLLVDFLGIIHVLMTFLTIYQQIMRILKTQALLNFLQLLVTLLAGYILIPPLGIIGAITSIIIGELTNFIPSLIIYIRVHPNSSKTISNDSNSSK
jgi:O-antigen/teichoic acid export membrane protein